MTTTMNYETITCDQLNQLSLADDAIELIDVRTPIEFRVMCMQPLLEIFHSVHSIRNK